MSTRPETGQPDFAAGNIPANYTQFNGLPMHRPQHSWRQGQKFLALFLALVLVIAALTPVLHPRAQHRPVRLGNGTTTGDLVLYRDIDEAVRHGAGYYAAATRLQRERDYPLRPFLTVRPPTLSWLYAGLGETGMLALAVLLTGLAAVLWYGRLWAAGRTARIGAAALVSTIGAMGLDGHLVCSHEWWSGLLVCCALALDGHRRFGWRLACAVLAALIRELAAPLLVLMLAMALWERRWRQAGAVLGAIVILCGLLLLHRGAVEQVLLAGDRASQGWLGLRGVYGYADDLALLTGLDWLWPPLATLLALLPLAGWVRHMPGTRVDLLWFAGFIAMVGIAARPDNFYWAQMLLPAYALGFLLLIVPPRPQPERTA